MRVTYIIMIADHIPQCNTVEERIGHEEEFIINSPIMSWVDNSSIHDSKESLLKTFVFSFKLQETCPRSADSTQLGTISNAAKQMIGNI